MRILGNSAKEVEMIEEKKKSNLDLKEVSVNKPEKTIYFFFFVNQGSGGQMSHLLLGLEIHEISFPNILGEKQLPGVDKLQVKICSLRNEEDRNKHFAEVRALSKQGKCSPC